MPVVGAEIRSVKCDDRTGAVTEEGLIGAAACADGQILPAEGTVPMVRPSDHETEIEIDSIPFRFVLIARLTKFWTQIPIAFSRIVDVR